MRGLLGRPVRQGLLDPAWELLAEPAIQAPLDRQGRRGLPDLAREPLGEPEIQVPLA